MDQLVGGRWARRARQSLTKNGSKERLLRVVQNTQDTWDSHQDENHHYFRGLYMSPNPRVINLHITNHIQYPEPLSTLHTSPKKTISIPSIPCHTRIFVESLFKSGHSSSRAFWNPHEKRKTWKCPHQNHLIYQTKKKQCPNFKKKTLFKKQVSFQDASKPLRRMMCRPFMVSTFIISAGEVPAAQGSQSGGTNMLCFFRLPFFLAVKAAEDTIWKTKVQKIEKTRIAKHLAG